MGGSPMPWTVILLAEAKDSVYPAQIPTLTANPECDGIWRRDLREVLRSGRWGPQGWDSCPNQKDPTVSPHPFLHLERGAVTGPYQHPDLTPPASRTVGNKHLLIAGTHGLRSFVTQALSSTPGRLCHLLHPEPQGHPPVFTGSSMQKRSWETRSPASLSA